MNLLSGAASAVANCTLRAQDTATNGAITFTILIAPSVGSLLSFDDGVTVLGAGSVIVDSTSTTGGVVRLYYSVSVGM